VNKKDPFGLTVKPSNYNRKVELLVSELDERIESIIQWLPFLVAQDVLENLRRSSPKDVAGYPKMLQLRQIDLRDVDSTIGVLAPGYAHSQRLKGMDAPHTLLFIRPKTMVSDNGKREVSQIATLLAKHSPWTMNTLPFEPPTKMAAMRSVKATETEVKKIEIARKADLPAVKDKLQKLGVQLRKGGSDPFSRRVTRDIAFEVLRREFGIEAPHRAHWRPAIRAARTEYTDAALEQLIRWFTIPSERRWKKDLVIKKEQPSVAKRVGRFQMAVAGSR